MTFNSMTFLPSIWTLDTSVRDLSVTHRPHKIMHPVFSVIQSYSITTIYMHTVGYADEFCKAGQQQNAIIYSHS